LSAATIPVRVNKPATPEIASTPNGALPAGLVFFLVLLAACFGKPLLELFQFGLRNDLYSHVLLVPAISAYLVWLQRIKLPARDPSGAGWGAAWLVLGLGFAGFYWFKVFSRWQATPNDRLSLATFAGWCCVVGGVAWFRGMAMVKVLRFPLAFLVFTIPLPSALESQVVNWLQHRSADAVGLLFEIANTPVLRAGTEFQVPGIAPFNVAPECCGIRSTLVLFMTGLLAGHLLLRRPWTKLVLAVGVIGLGILRNGFRIFSLAELSRHVNPKIMDSGLHHRGGPLFFVVSLLPFFLLLWSLRRCERPAVKRI